MSVVLRAVDVGIGYHGRDALLTGCDLEVEAGSVVGLAGPSGCGKSTLLRVLGGLQHPSHGSVVAGPDRRPIVEFRRSRPGILGLVGQDPVSSLDPLWSVASIIEEAVPASERSRDRVREALARVGLTELDPRTRPGALSIGQCQRVALARALANSPLAVLADEPTSALDPTNAANVVRLLRTAADAGSAVVVSSHDGPLLNSLCDIVFTWVDGRLSPQVSSD